MITQVLHCPYWGCSTILEICYAKPKTHGMPIRKSLIFHQFGLGYRATR